ncbi:sonic hedgehog protein [Caerostris darwini]|uniref:Protein hedgehog n=1 Tax=Caerostris darwini TaxID=1538125 RepID=A0AAV4T6C0_9ARAC|nr:sonic hedgehog protein [Caerostris darwini]
MNSAPKYGMLARLAVEAGFDYVYYESRAHIHASVKPESADGSRSGGCFSGNTTVYTPKGQKRMSELRAGEMVLSVSPNGRLEFSEVITFLDRDPGSDRTYLKIHTESGRTITLTPTHLIFTEPNKSEADIQDLHATYAKNIQIGHYVFVVKNATSTTRNRVTLEKVRNVTVATEFGGYAPLTRHGTVVVNDVVASCYAMLSDQDMAHSAFGPYRLWHTIKKASTSVLSTLHLMSSRTSESQHTGIHWYAKLLRAVTKAILPRNYLYT